MTVQPKTLAPQEPQPIREDPCLAGEAAIRRLRKKANHGLHVLTGFIVLSIAAQYDFSFLPTISPAYRSTLGAGPTAGFISMALVVYLFSAVITALSRMMSGSAKVSGYLHLGYLGAFYGFFHLSGTLADNIWAVVGSGLTILSLEAYQIWTYCQEEIKREQETLDLRKRFATPADDRNS